MFSQADDSNLVLSPVARQRIEEKVGAYVDTWKRYRAGTPSDRQRPDPSGFLQDSTGEERLVLLRRLCEVDISCRREMGDHPRREDYDRFPEVAAALLHLFEDGKSNDSVQESPNLDFPAAGEGITPSWQNPGLPIRPSAPQDPLPLLPEGLIPGYRILKELNRGGQGIVYQAIQKSTRRKVALKLMLQGPFAAPDSKRRFEREIALVGSLRHPNIVPIFDSGMAQGQFFYAMEYVRGERLDRYVERKGLNLRRTLELFKWICDAIDYAHQKGVIHRDLKPSNILVDDTGHPHVLDFGLAKVGGAELDEDAQSNLVSVTGQIIGSPAYMCPEQASGRPDLIDLRSDVYALGVILYELLTKTHPYEVTGKINRVLDNIKNVEPLPPSSLRRDIDDEVETILLKSLSKEKERRYDTAGALGRDIGRYLAGEPIEAKRDSALYLLKKTLRRYRAAALIAGNLAALIVLALIASLASWRAAALERDRQISERKFETERREVAEKLAADQAATSRQLERSYNALYFEQIHVAQEAYRHGEMSFFRDRLDHCPEDRLGWEWRHLDLCATLAKQEYVQVAEQNAAVSHLASSADGKWFATGDEHGVIRVFHMASCEATVTLTDPGGALNSLDFHPQGDRILSVASDGSLKIWHLMKPDSPIEIASTGARIQSALFTTDGRGIVVRTAKGIQFWELGSEPVQSSFLPNHSGLDTLSVGRDGLYIIAVVGLSARWVCRADTGERVFNIPVEYVRRNTFSYDGRSLVLGGEDGTVRVLRLGVDVQPRSLLGSHEAAVKRVATSHDGSRVVSGSDDGLVKVWDYQSGALLQTFRTDNPNFEVLDISADGLRVFAVDSTGGLRIWNVGARQPSWTIYGALGNGLVLSPTGKWCVVLWRNLGEIQLWDLASRVVRRQFATPDFEPTCAAATHEGTMLAVGSESTPGVLLWDTRTWQLKQRRSLSGSATSLLFSPTEDWLAIAGSKEGENEAGILVLWDPKTDQVREIPLPALDYAPLAFFPDGRQLAIGTAEDGIWILDTTTGRRLQTFRSGRAKSLYVSQKSDWLLVGDSNGATIWDLKTGQVKLERLAATPVRCMALLQDESRIIAGMDDGTVELWDVATGSHALVLRHGSTAVQSVGVVAGTDTILSYSRGEFSRIRSWCTSPSKGQVPEPRARRIERAIRQVEPVDVWDYPVELATAYVQSLRDIEYVPRNDEMNRAARLLREVQQDWASTESGLANHVRAVQRVVLQPQTWFIVGPFSSGPDHEKWDDEFGPERISTIDPGEQFEGAHGPVEWRKATVHAWDRYPRTTNTGRHVVDLLRFYPRADLVIAYALTYINSPIDQEVELCIGSDDGVKVWLNDEIILDNAVYRPYVRAEDRVSASLKKGLNKLLIKIDQSGDRWAFGVEFLDLDGWPADVKWSLDPIADSKIWRPITGVEASATLQ